MTSLVKLTSFVFSHVSKLLIKPVLMWLSFDATLNRNSPVGTFAYYDLDFPSEGFTITQPVIQTSQMLSSRKEQRAVAVVPPWSGNPSMYKTL